jgi:molybdenum cofactor synthesis domain-containing protein
MNLRFGIIILSDRSSRGERDDLSGPALASFLETQGCAVLKSLILPDDESALRQTLSEWADGGKMDVILTTGSTGFAPRDIAPEATKAVIQKDAPGLAELMRAESLKKTQHAALSRAVAGIRARTLIVNLPGSPKGALENLGFIFPVIPHAVQLMKDDPASENSH